MRKVVCIILLIIFMTSFSITTYAITPGDFKPGNEAFPEKLKDIGGNILWIVQLVGYGISVITLTMIGIQYMLSSTNERADIKKRLMPFTIGALILFGGSFILTIVSKFTEIIQQG